MTQAIRIWTMALAAVGVGLTSAEAEVLYDGSLGTLPGTQGWLYLTNPVFGPDATQTISSAGVVLDSTPDMGEQAGYFRNFPLPVTTHNRNDGFWLDFTARVGEETHSSNNRAGFSVIALSEDLLGIELGFWEDQVWAQSGADFVHAEGAALDTTSGLIDYQLRVVGGTYELWAAGSPLLDGPLRDYSSHSNPVYSSPSLLFFGDDTTSAEAIMELSYVSLQTGTAVPEPTAWLLAVVGGIVWSFRLRRTSSNVF